MVIAYISCLLLLASVCSKMAHDVNIYVDLYDQYDMDEADEEEMEEMKKAALAWLQEHGHTRVLRPGRCVCPYCNLAH